MNVGSTWQAVEPPKGAHVKSLSAGAPWCIWALDARGCLHVRCGISQYQNQSGSEWKSITSYELDDVYAKGGTFCVKCTTRISF